MITSGRYADGDSTSVKSPLRSAGTSSAELQQGLASPIATGICLTIIVTIAYSIVPVALLGSHEAQNHSLTEKVRGSRVSASSRWKRQAREASYHAFAPAPPCSYFGDSVTGTSVMESTGSLLSSAALRTAASLGPS